MRLLSISALLSVLAPLSFSQVDSSLALLPQGAFAAEAPGTLERVTRVGAAYRFAFVDNGIVEVEYEIDVQNQAVQDGLLHVVELQSGGSPLVGAGLTWRTGFGAGATANYEFAEEHAVNSDTVLFHEHLDSATGMLELKYRETRAATATECAGAAATKTYRFWLEGKVLRIRLIGDPDRDSFRCNYGFVDLGRSEHTLLNPAMAGSGAYHLPIPYMGNVVVLPFGSGWISSYFFDWYASGGVAWSNVLGSGSSSPDSYSHYFPTVTDRGSDPVGQAPADGTILHHVDETLNLIVTRDVEDTFPVPPSYRSPYYELTSGRTYFRGTNIRPRSHLDYAKRYEQLREWGLSELFISQYANFKWGQVPMTPDADLPGLIGVDPGTLGPSDFLPDYDHDWGGGNIITIRVIKPDEFNLIEQVKGQFGTLAANARSTGGLFSSLVAHPSSDPWGSDEELPTPETTFNFYPTGKGTNPDIPLHRPFWKLSNENFGLPLPDTNASFNATRIKRDYVDADGDSVLDMLPALKGWTTLAGSTWNTPDLYGFRMAEVDSKHYFDHVVAQLGTLKTDFGSTAMSLDAYHVLPGRMDRDRAATDKTHTMGEALRERTRAVRELRDWMGGPVYGELTHFRTLESYEWGVRDGLRANFPTGDTVNTEDAHDEWVVPDYALRQILTKSGGNAGMGYESKWGLSMVLPMMQEPTQPWDGPAGDGWAGTEAYMNSWVTAIATYGHNAFTTSNGAVTGDHWTVQGLLRNHFTIWCLSREQRRSGPVQSILYSDASSGPYTLSEVLDASTGVPDVALLLKNPRIEITYGSGPGQLVLKANHDVAGGTSWDVGAVDPDGAALSVRLEPDGFVAYDGEDLLVIFNGTVDPELPTELGPFDYVDYRGYYRMLNNRAVDDPQTPGVYDGITFGGFPPANLANEFGSADLDILSEALIVHDQRFDTWVGAQGGLWNNTSGNSWSSGEVYHETPSNQRTVVAITLDGGSQVLLTNKPAGLLALGTTEAGVTTSAPPAPVDVTPLCDWTILAGDATVNQGGVVTAFSGSSVTVQATHSASGLASTAVLAVQAGEPVADTSLTPYLGDVVPGRAYQLNGRASQDPAGGLVDGTWTLPDGEQESGLVVGHTFHTPVTGSATLSLVDVEGNSGAVPGAVSVATNPGTWGKSVLWADSFDDGDVDDYSATAGLWGVVGGRLVQSETGTGDRSLGVPGGPHPATASYTVQVDFTGSATGEAGLDLWNSSPDGFRAYLRGSDQSVVIERELVGFFVSPPGSFDLARSHELRVLSNGSNVRVYVDGIKYHDLSISTNPNSDGSLSAWSRDTAAEFEDLRVTSMSPAAPVVTMVPMEYQMGEHVSIYLDDQDGGDDFFGAIDSFTLSLLTEQGTQTYSGTGILQANGGKLLPPSWEVTNNPASSTWLRLDFAQDLDQLIGNGTWLEIEMTCQDSNGFIGAKRVRYDKP